MILDNDRHRQQLAHERLVAGGARGLGRVVGQPQPLAGECRRHHALVVGASVCALWAFGATFAVFKVVNAIRSMRPTEQEELEGLDVPQFGLLAYPEDEAFAAE